jgi:hypothetical protein
MEPLRVTNPATGQLIQTIPAADAQAATPPWPRPRGPARPWAALPFSVRGAHTPAGSPARCGTT